MKRYLFLSVCLAMIFAHTEGQDISRYFLYNNYPLEITDVCEVSSGGFMVAGNSTDFGVYPLLSPLIFKISNSGNIEWTKLVNFDPSLYINAHVSSLHEIPGTGFLVSGSTRTVNLLENFFVIQYDYFGNVNWIKAYETLEFYQPWFKHRLSLLNSGEMLFTGTKNGAAAYNLRLDNQGNALWGKTYILDTTCFIINACGAIELGNGDIISIGQFNLHYMLKTHAGGSKIWLRRFENLMLYNESVYKTLDNKIIICGSQQDSSNALFNISVTKLDTSGNVLWSKKYVPPIMSSLKFNDLIQMEDSSFVIACNRISNNPFDYFPIVLLHVDKEGGLLSSSKIDTTFLNGLYNAYTLKYLGNDTIVLAGGSYFFKFNLDNGLNCNENTYSFTEYNFPLIVNTEILTVGNFISPVVPSYNMSVIAIDNGNYCDLVSLNSDLTETICKVYPNPVDNILYIENSLNCEKYQFYNVEGKLLFEILDPENTSEINVSSFPKGIYFMKLCFENESVIKKVSII